ncbi:MFS transporter [Streptomyces sp. NPDC005373]|uniref:MFS transporter n=1 Tax=Streptomyces sp. NPDC005373 TaxID=3156879 RepID=UPI0033AC5D12
MPAVVLGRVLQGGFGALVTAAALAMVATGFTGPREGVRTFGVYAVVSVGGPVLGLLTGGSLPACPILGFNLVFALVALVASAYCRTTPRWTAPTPTPVPPSTCLPGALLGCLGPAALTFGLTRAQWWTDWGDQRVVGALAIGLVLLTLLWRQSQTSSPLLSLYVLRDRSLLGDFLTMALTGAGILCLMPPLAQIMGYGTANPTDQCGILLLPMLAAIVTGSTLIAPCLLARAVPPRRLIVAGSLITLLGLAPVVIAIGAEAPYMLLLPCVVLAGLVFTPLFAGATIGVVPRHSGATAGALITAQSIGPGLGTAVYSSLNGPPCWAVLCLLLAGLTAGLMRTTGTSNSLALSGG